MNQHPTPIPPHIYVQHLFGAKSEAVFTMLLLRGFDQVSLSEAIRIMIVTLLYHGLPPDTAHVYAIIDAVTQPGLGPKWGISTKGQPLGYNPDFPGHPTRYTTGSSELYYRIDSQVKNFWDKNGLGVLAGKFIGVTGVSDSQLDSMFERGYGSVPNEHWDERVEALEQRYHAMNLVVNSILMRIGGVRLPVVSDTAPFDLTTHTASPEDIDAIGHGPNRRQGNFGVPTNELLVVREFSDTIPEEVYEDLRAEYVKRFPQGEDFSQITDTRLLSEFEDRVRWTIPKLFHQQIDPSVENVMFVLGIASQKSYQARNIAAGHIKVFMESQSAGAPTESCVPAETTADLQVGGPVHQGGLRRGEMYVVSGSTLARHNVKPEISNPRVERWAWDFGDARITAGDSTFKATEGDVTTCIRHTGPGYISN